MPRQPRLIRYGTAALALSLLAAMGLSACAAPLNFTSPGGPLYQGCEAPQVAPRAAGESLGAEGPELRVVTFNIKYSREIERAIDLLGSEPELRRADLILLQEMDEAGVERIGRALDLCWVYYPATLHPARDNNFGNAILSRLPLADPAKIILPHLGQFGGTQRIATAATVLYRGQPVRVYSVHIATQVELGPERRRHQVAAVIADAARWGGRVIIGGDINDSHLARSFEAAGFGWTTRTVGRTCKLWSFDHVFARGLAPSGPAGKILDNRGASDHRPVWVSMVMPAPAAPRTPAAGRSRL